MRSPRAVLAYFGFIHGTALGFGNASPVALGYLLIALICLGFAWQGQYARVETPEDAIAEPGD